MTIEDIKSEIKKTGYMENILIGNYFHMKYKKLYNDIKNISNTLESTYKVNQGFRSRVIFIMKYNCDINLITKEGRYLTFEKDKDDFVLKSDNSAKQGWENSVQKSSIQGVYTIYELKDLIKLLSDDEIFGRSKNRILMKKNSKLYNSILHYSQPINIFNRNSNKLPSKILFIRDYNCDLNKLLCNNCKKNYVNYNPTNNKFNHICKKCYYLTDDFYPQIGYFKKKYGDEWEKYYKEDREKIKDKKVNSLEWFVKKYGENLGEEKYKIYSSERVKNITNLSLSSYSKISQELFWLIYDNLSDNEKTSCYFKELNREVFITVNNKTYIPDFIYKNKIIEYDGVYWHNNIKDEKRKDFYIKNGYELLVISDTEFNRQKKPNTVVDKCLNFLKK